MVDVNDPYARGLERRKRMLGATQVENAWLRPAILAHLYKT